MPAHDRFAAHELIHRYWFLYDEGRLDELAAVLAPDCRLRSRTETGQHPFEEFIASDCHGLEEASQWTKEHRRRSPYPLRHHAANIHATVERGVELDLDSYLFVTQIVDRVPRALSSGIVHWTLRLAADGYRVLAKDVVLDSIESKPFHDVQQVADRQRSW